jgi:V8-like Glu-specific endopeptidase
MPVDYYATIAGVPVAIEESERPVPSACNTRDDCWDPDLNLGVRVRKGSTTGSVCGMGFHIVIGGDEQFLTAGHCGYSGANCWYHTNLPGTSANPGRIGCELGTLYTASTSQDAMRVQMNDIRASDVMYTSRRVIDTTRYPYVNDLICGDLVNSNIVDCGYVYDSYVTYSFDASFGVGTYTVAGAAVNDVSSVAGGDSGSPWYFPGTSGIGSAVGIQSAKVGSSDAYFARIGDVLGGFNASLY